MRLYKLTIILSWLLVGLSINASAQALDSLLSERQISHQEYIQFYNNMTERTWTKLIELNDLARKVISTDNELIWIHLNEEIAEKNEIKSHNESAAIEIAFLKKESEQSKSQLNEQRTLNKLFAVIILSTLLLLIILVISLAILHRKNKKTHHELRKFWAMNDEQSLILLEKEQFLNKQLRLLDIENQAMQSEMAELASQKKQTNSTAKKQTNRLRKDDKQANS